MKLFRSIAINENEELNTENIGNSWTLCEIFAEDHFEDYNRFANKDGFVILSIEIDIKDIDLDETLFSMETREYEYEVVVNNLDTVAEVHSTNIDKYEDKEFKIHTGERYFEDYLNGGSYEGELTVKNLEKLISEI